MIEIKALIDHIAWLHIVKKQPSDVICEKGSHIVTHSLTEGLQLEIGLCCDIIVIAAKYFMVKLFSKKNLERKTSK